MEVEPRIAVAKNYRGGGGKVEGGKKVSLRRFSLADQKIAN